MEFNIICQYNLYLYEFISYGMIVFFPQKPILTIANDFIPLELLIYTALLYCDI